MRHAFVLAALLVACSKSEENVSSDRAPDGGPLNPIGPNDPRPSDPSNPSATGADTHISGSRLKRRVLKGSDGSQQFLGWFDSQTSRPCSFMKAADGKQRCLPGTGSAVVTTNLYSDASCTQPIITTYKTCGAPPQTVAIVDSIFAYCDGGFSYRVYNVGGAVQPATLYSKTGTGCTSTSPQAYTSYDLYSSAGEVPLASFVEATEDAM